MKIICIGSSGKDIFFPTSDGVILETPDDLKSRRKIVFELGAKYHIEDRHEALGGCAANVACGLSRLGLEVDCYTKTGDDYLGQWIKAELEKEKVKTGLIQVEKNTSSDLSSVIVDEKSGERTIFASRDANENLEIFPNDFQKFGWLFVSALNGNQKESWEDNLKKILSIVNGEIKLAFNPGPENIKTNPQAIIEACQSVDVLIVNKDEALEIVLSLEAGNKAKLSDEIFLLGELKKLGPQVVTITDGMRGAWTSDGNNLFFAPALGVDPIETTGAGDAFSSGFLGAIVKQKSLREALKWGIINSANSVKFFGAINGLMSEEDVLKKIDQIEIKKLDI
jgi:sugar/nucleoside kinase (ribokinase family)